MGGLCDEREDLQAQAPSRETVGSWELIERIGQGAFGVVHLVEQREPIPRQAAMKILRPAMVSGDTSTRFEAELKALALMDHPGIVTVFDAGTTEDGRPFFVMEYVEGEPVTTFAREKHLSQEDRLRLFDRICSAVEHAHFRGLIHRDLKPANILVFTHAETGEPTVRLLDFGVAKATESVLTDATLITTEGQLLGTPEYMSPEQATGSEVDTRSDVYSLGIILYELLTGKIPFPLESRALEPVLSYLQETQNRTPPRASTFAKGGAIPIDLDWIIGKALEPEMGRRYQSVRELREDLQRLAENRPIRARPPEASYRLSRFLKRRWKLATVAAVVALSITTAAIVSTVMAMRTRAALKETATAWSRGDLANAIQNLEELKLTSAGRFLYRAVKSDPSNEDATRLLRSMQDVYSVPTLIEKSVLYNRGIDQAYFRGEGEIIAITEDGNLHWYDDGAITETLRVQGSHHRLKVDASGSLAAVSNLQGQLHLIDLVERKFRFELLSSNKGSFEQLLFAGDLLLAASRANGVEAWDLESGERKWQIQSGQIPIALAVSPATSTLAIGYGGGRIEGIDIATGDPTGKRIYLDRSLATLTPKDEDHFLSVDKSGLVREIGFRAMSEVSRPIERLTGDFLVAQHSESQTAFATNKEVVVLDETKVPRQIHRLPLARDVVSLTFHANASHLTIGTHRHGTYTWDFRQGRVLAFEMEASTHPVAVSHTSHYQVVTRRGNLVRYQLGALVESTPQIRTLVDIPPQWQSVPPSQRGSLPAPFPPLDSLPDDIPAFYDAKADVIYAGYRDGLIHFWNRETGELLESFTARSDGQSVRCASLNAKTNWIVYNSGYGEATMRRFPISKNDTGVKLSLPSKKRALSSIVISPNSEIVSISSFAGSSQLYAIQTGEAISEPMRHEAIGDLTAHFSRFSDDSTHLLSWGGMDQTVRIWKISEGISQNPTIQLTRKPVAAGFHPEDDTVIWSVEETAEGNYANVLWSRDRATRVTPDSLSPDFLSGDQLPLPKSQPKLTSEELLNFERAFRSRSFE